MPRRRTTSTQDALELFLDTISNTFGGVVFIALLVAILIQVTDKQQREQDPEAVRKALQADVVANELEAQRLKRMLEQLRQTSEANELSPEFKRQSELAALQDELDSLNAQLAEFNDDLAARRRTLIERQAELAGLAGNNSRIENEAEQVKLRLEQISNLDQQQIRLPRFQRVQKRQIAVLLERGRLVFVFTDDEKGLYGKLNRRQLQVSAGGKELRLRHGQGVRVENTDQFRNALRDRLRDFDQTEDYIYAAVWPDSYEEFTILRDNLLEMQFGYGLVIMAPDDSVRLGTSSGAGEQ